MEHSPSKSNSKPGAQHANAASGRADPFGDLRGVLPSFAMLRMSAIFSSVNIRGRTLFMNAAVDFQKCQAAARQR
jgi:hypothetical protein